MGTFPMKMGPAGRVPRRDYRYLCDAFASITKIGCHLCLVDGPRLMRGKVGVGGGDYVVRGVRSITAGSGEATADN